MVATTFSYPPVAPADRARAGWRTLRLQGRAADGPLPRHVRLAGQPQGLPRAERVLAVTARPGPESADLGALLYTFGRVGARVALLSLTRGEASYLSSSPEPLESVRPWELRVAAHLLGVSSVAIADYPDGRLSSCQRAALTERVSRAIADQSADLLLVSDPAENGLDEAMVAMAVCGAVQATAVPALARTVFAARGGWRVDLGADASRARAAQCSAVAAHASQTGGLADTALRLRLLGQTEWLRWLVPPPAPWQVLR